MSTDTAVPPEAKPSTTERAHHPWSPSTLQPRLACSGYKGENSTNQAAETGTFIHDCIEKHIDGGPLDPGLDDDQANVVESCKAFVLEQKESMGPDTILIMEEYLPIDSEETTAGYLDIGLVNPVTRKAKIIDWKTGQNPVAPTRDNLQGKAYMLGLLRKFNDGFDECEVIFVMPFQGETGLVDAYTFTRETFSPSYLQILSIVAQAKAVAADFENKAIVNTWQGKLKPYDGTCLFCARKAECPALLALTVNAANKYDPLIVPEVINPMLIKDAAQAGAALKFFSIMEGLSKAYRAKATEKAMTDEVWLPEGYMITTMTTRKIIDNVKFYDTIKDLLTEDELMQAIDFTLGPVEDAIKAKAPRGQKAAAIEELGQLLKMNGATQESEPIIQLRQKRKAKVESTPTLT